MRKSIIALAMTALPFVGKGAPTMNTAAGDKTEMTTNQNFVGTKLEGYKTVKVMQVEDLQSIQSVNNGGGKKKPKASKKKNFKRGFMRRTADGVKKFFSYDKGLQSKKKAQRNAKKIAKLNKQRKKQQFRNTVTDAPREAKLQKTSHHYIPGWGERKRRRIFGMLNRDDKRAIRKGKSNRRTHRRNTHRQLNGGGNDFWKKTGKFFSKTFSR